MNPGAQAVNQQGIDLEVEGRVDQAEAAYREAARLDPSWSAPSFNLGLLLKRLRRWPESLAANQEALRRDPQSEGAWWNLGIAATALADWGEARRAWRGFGIEVPDGEGELRLDLGLVPIRLRPAASAEVVWCTRIDPARAVIENIPLAVRERRWRDVLLHDGEPRGARVLQGREVPVFDELEVFAASGMVTTGVELSAPDAGAFDELSRRAEARPDTCVEDWTHQVRWICRECSQGVPHQHDEGVPAPAAPGPREVRRFGLAARGPEDVRALLGEWVAGGAGRLYLLER